MIPDESLIARFGPFFLPWSLFLRNNYYSQSEGIHESKRGSSVCSAKEPFDRSGAFQPGEHAAVVCLSCPRPWASPPRQPVRERSLPLRAETSSLASPLDIGTSLPCPIHNLDILILPHLKWVHALPACALFVLLYPREILCFLIFLRGIDVPLLAEAYWFGNVFRVLCVDSYFSIGLYPKGIALGWIAAAGASVTDQR